MGHHKSQIVNSSVCQFLCGRKKLENFTSIEFDGENKHGI